MKIIKEWHSQQRRYGDYYDHYEIETDEDRETFIKAALKELAKREIPDEDEWHKNIRYGGERQHDMNYYFSGYYQVEQIPGGYIFEIVHPYDD